MGYSYAETSAITCLHCQKTFDGEVWFIIDAGDRPNLIERIKQGALHTFPCPHCQQAVTIDAPLLILRALGNPVLLFSPAQATTNDQDQEHARWLLGHLRDDMGDQWQDDWLTRGLRGISRDQLPSALSGDPKGVPGPANDGRGQLLNLLQQFIQADNWADSRLVVEAHPELLSARTDVVLLQLIEGVRGQYDADVEVRLNEYRELLARCREIGIAQAFAEKVGSAADETDVLTGLSANWQNAQVAVRRYQATGDRSALDEAIAMWERILEINSLSTDLEPLHIQAMNSAAATYLCRYLSCGFSSDLDHALSLLQKLVHLMPSNSPEQPGFLTNLGNGLRARYARSGDLADLEQAIDAWQRALNLTPRNMPARSVILCNLGAGLRVRYASRRDPADLDAAVDNFRDALQLVSPGDLGRGTIFNNLGNCLRDRYNIRGDSADLEAAVDSFQKAVDMALPNTPERALRLTNLGTGLHARYERKGNLADLEAAIDRFQQAVELIPLNATDRARCLDNLGTGLRTRYKRSGDPADLEAAVGYFRQAVGLTLLGDPDRVGHLDDLGTGLHDRYNRNGDPADLDAAVDCYQQAIELTPPNDPDRASRLNSLGTGLHTRYERSGNPADLDAAVDCCRQAVELTPPNTSERALHFTSLGDRLHTRYKYKGDPADLEAAVDSFRDALQSLPPDAPGQGAILNNLGAVLRTRYNRNGNPADLEGAINSFQQAINLIPLNFTDRTICLDNLGAGLRAQYASGGVLADLEAAVGYFRQAVELTPPGDPERAGRLGDLGTGLRTRYKRSGDPADLEAAVGYFRQAVELTPPGDPDRVGHLDDLGTGLHDRYNLNGDPADLEAAIDCYQQAIELTPPNDPDRASHLNSLGTGLHDRYIRNGDPADLETAVDYYRQAVELTPPNTSERAVYFSNIGINLRDRYERNGDPADLEAAVDSFRQAVELTSPVAPDRADYLSNLGTGLRMRYVRGGVLADLKAAIGCYQQAVELTPLDAFERTSHLTNLGNGLHDRYERNGDPADLDAAVDCYRQAVELTPHSAPKRGPILNNLGAGLHKRYLHNGDPVSLEAAVDSFRQAIELTPPGDLRRAEYLSNLSVDLRARFARNGDPADLAAAIDCCQQAVELIPHDTTHRAMILYTLAAGLHDRYDRSGDPADLEQAIQSYRSACTGGFLYNHNLVVVVARSWLYWATLRHNWYEAVEAFNYVRRATDILVTVQWDRAAKSDWLREVQGLAARGAYALSQRSQLSQSVEALEGGLARLLSEALEGNRRDLERLPSLGYGSLYGRYRMGTASWAALMQTQPYAGVDITVEEQTSHNRLNLLHETRAAIDAAIDDIRRVPGYEDFFRSLPYARIQALASLDTPVVYLATTSVGSLGLIVWPDTVEAIDIAVTERDLNRLLIEWEAQGNAATGGYLIAQLGVASALPAELAKTLPILGEKLMPLVDHLRTRGATGVTLIPTGRLSLLPLHAATYTRDGKTLCLLDDFVVAYTPSAQALAVARENVQQRASMPLRLAGVGNPSPNSRPLTYAKPELQSIVELMPAGAAQPLYERQATKPALAATLPRATVAHLSCHGSFNVAEPLDSGLMLGDGPWTLREILDQPKALETVRLVVLSACQTAITDFQNLPDEAIGLPAGLLQAGVPAIVGTLWSVNDASTALLMVRFYELMLSEYLRPHEALCRAQRWLRDLTMHDLEEYVARHEAIARAHAEAGDRMSDSLSHALNLKVFTADNPDAQPFRDPYYWAPFTFTGATEVIL